MIEFLGIVGTACVGIWIINYKYLLARYIHVLGNLHFILLGRYIALEIQMMWAKMVLKAMTVYGKRQKANVVCFLQFFVTKNALVAKKEQVREACIIVVVCCYIIL